MALEQYDEVFEKIAEQNARLSGIDPELDAIFQKRGRPKNFIPEPEKMEWYRKISATATARFMQTPFVRETLGSLPNSDLETEHRKITALDGYQIPLRIYRPKSGSEGRPVMLMSHGGGWCLGDLDTEDFICQLICRKLDIVVVAVGYRLAPEVKLLTIVSDVYDALQWVSKQAPTFGGDLSKGFLNAGVSGGGNLTVASTYLARKENVQPSLTGTMYMCTGMPHESQDSHGNLLDLWPGKLVSWYVHDQAPSSNRETNSCYREFAEPDIFSTIFTPFNETDHSNLPPLYYQVCGMDPWRDSAIFYTHLVSEAGAPTKMDIYPGLPHCWWPGYSQVSQTKKWAEDTIKGVKWLLEQSVDRKATRSRL